MDSYVSTNSLASENVYKPQQKSDEITFFSTIVKTSPLSFFFIYDLFPGVMFVQLFKEYVQTSFFSIVSILK